MFLIHTDDQPTGIRLFLLPKAGQLDMGIGDHRPKPGVLKQRGLQPFALPIKRQSVLKCRLMLAAVGQPTQLTFIARKDDRPADAVADRVTRRRVHWAASMR